MKQSVSDFLSDQNKRLLAKILQLQAVIEGARSASTQQECTICVDTELCTPHRQLAELTGLDHISAVKALELEVAELRVIANSLTAQLDELTAINAEAAARLPAQLKSAKMEAVREYDTMVEERSQYNSFIDRIARRLGVRIDSTIERNQSMVEDAIRKLLS